MNEETKELKDNVSCTCCIYYRTPYFTFPCNHCSMIFIGPTTALYFEDKEK